MAQVILVREKVEKGGIPAFCLRCGEPATEFKKKRIVWRVGLPSSPIIPVIGPTVRGIMFIWGLLFNAEYVETSLPFCARHRNHFFHYSLLRITLWVLAIALFLSVMAEHSILLLVFGPAFVLFLLFFLLSKPGIKVEEITGWSILLSGVSPVFVRNLVTDGYLESTPEESPKKAEDDPLGLPKYPS